MGSKADVLNYALGHLKQSIWGLVGGATPTDAGVSVFLWLGFDLSVYTESTSIYS